MSPRWGALCYLNLMGFFLLFTLVVDRPEPRPTAHVVIGVILFSVLGSPLLPLLSLLRFPLVILPVAVFVNAFLWATCVEWILRRFADGPRESQE